MKKIISVIVTLAVFAAALPFNVGAVENGMNIIKTDILAEGLFNSEGYGSIRIDTNNWEKQPEYALINNKGEFVFNYGDFPCEFSLYDGIFVNGIVTSIDEYGFEHGIYSLFNLNGEQIIDEAYDEISFYNGYGVARNGNGETAVRKLIDSAGNVVFEFPYGFNLTTAAGGGAYVFNYNSDPAYSYFGNMGGCRDGLLWVCCPAVKENLSDAENINEVNRIFEQYHQQMGWFGGPDCGYIDLTGKVVIPPQYISVKPFVDGLAAVREYIAPSVPVTDLPYETDLGGKWKYINKNGADAFDRKFSSASNFSGGYAFVSDDSGKYGYIDKNGQQIIPFEYDNAFGSGDGKYFAVGNNMGGTIKYGLVNADNQIVVPLEYDDISSFTESVAYAIKDGFVYIITENTVAKANTQEITIDGKKVIVNVYALVDENGGETNYVKLRDIAYLLNGTQAQFEVEWDGSINLAAGRPYTENGSELSTPFSGDRNYTVSDAVTKIGGEIAELDTIVLTDENGGEYTYYKLRDIGRYLNFNVGWNEETGIFVETENPYRQN